MLRKPEESYFGSSFDEETELTCRSLVMALLKTNKESTERGVTGGVFVTKTSF